MHRSLSLAVVALGLTGPMVAGAQSGADTTTKVGIAVPKNESEFAQRLHQGNESEIKLSRLAQQKAPSQQVKELARMIVEDHQKADAQLQQLAKSKGWKLSEPKPMNATERAVMDANHAQMKELDKLQGRAFEYAYLAHMVAEHDMTITKVAMASQAYRGSELANSLQQMLPRLQRHRDRAYNLLGEIKANPQELGVGGSGRQDQAAPQAAPSHKGAGGSGHSGY